MSLTMGQMLFYGGMCGAAVVAVAAIISAAVFGGSRKRLKDKLNNEYGKAGSDD